MATYRIKAPDGRVYQVNGPAGATQAQVQKIVAQQIAARKPSKDPEPSTWSKIRGGLQTVQGGIVSALDGVLPGAGGVAGGVGATVANAAIAPFLDTVDFEPAKAFRKGRSETEGNARTFKKRNPGTATALSGAGMAASLALPVTKVGLGANALKAGLFRRAGNSAINAGIMGTASAAASSHANSVGEFARDTVRGGVEASAIGAGIPLAGRVFKAAGGDQATRAVARTIAPVVRKAGESLPGRTGQRVQTAAAIMAAPRAEVAALDHLGRKIEQGQTSPRQVQVELDRRRALGVEPAIADVNEPLRTAYGSAARQPGEATMAARRAIDERQRRMTQRVSETHIPEALGPTGNVERQAQALTAQAKADAAPLYDISNAQNVPYVRELQELMKRPIAKSALNDAAINLQNQGINPAQVGMVEVSPGLWDIGPKPTMEAWDYFKSALDRQVFAGKQPFAPLEATRDMRGAIDTRGRLLDIMDGDGSGNPWRPSSQPSPMAPGGPSLPNGGTVIDQAPQGIPGQAAPDGLPAPQGREIVPTTGTTSNVPALPDTGVGIYRGQRLSPEEEAAQAMGRDRSSAIPPEGLNPFWKPAREAYAGPTMDRQALEAGQDMARSNATDVSNRMEDMTGSQLDQFALGHRTGVADDVRTLGDYGNAARRVDGSIKHREALATVHGSEAADALGRRLDAEHQGHQTWATVRGNSMTAGREAEDAIQAQEIALTDAGKGLWSLATGRPTAAIGHFARGLSGEPMLTRDVNQRVASGLADLTEGGQRELLKDVRRATTVRKASTKRTIARNAKTGRLLGSRVAADTATDEDLPDLDELDMYPGQ